MAHIRSTRGGRAWFGKDEAKAAGRVSRRQVDAEEIREQNREAQATAEERRRERAARRADA
jgi:hypothetical protein